MSSERKVLKQLRIGFRHCGAPQGTVILAVSGGADSVALLRACTRLRQSEGLAWHVGHFNHRLRGALADADAAWVAELCERLRIPCTIGVAESIPTEATGVESRARSVRYQFLQELARQTAASAIVTAHTADDQAETVLHHLLRGTGLSGLRGMRWSRPIQRGSSISLLRPCLRTDRRLLRDFLAEIGQDFREDHTNAELKMTRNRLRTVVLPFLQQHVPQNVVRSLARLAEQADEWERVIELVAAKTLTEILLEASADSVRLKREPLRDQPRGLVTAIFKWVWERQQWPVGDMTLRHWEQLADCVTTDATHDFPGGVRVVSRADLLRIALGRVRDAASG